MITETPRYQAELEDFKDQDSFLKLTEKIQELGLHERGVVVITPPTEVTEKIEKSIKERLDQLTIPSYRRQKLQPVMEGLYRSDRTHSEDDQVEVFDKMTWDKWARNCGDEGIEDPQQFWEMVKQTMKKDESFAYASGIRRTLMTKNEGFPGWDMRTLKSRMDDFTSKKAIGITSAYTYVRAPGSFFDFHAEEDLLNSINYLFPVSIKILSQSSHS